MSSRYKYQSIRKMLAGYWRPSRGPTGNLLIDSVGGNHGTLTNGASWTPSAGGGKGGYALSFDGVDDYCSIGSAPGLNLPTQYTMSAWINAASVAANVKAVIVDCNIAGTSVQYALEINRTAGRFSMLANADVLALTSATTISVNRWYHVTATKSGTTSNWTYTIFLNGNQDGSAAVSANPYSQGGLAIGRFGNFNSFFFNGLIDDVFIANTALSPNEVLTIYNAGRGGLDQRISMPVVRGASVGGQTINLSRVTETESTRPLVVTNPNSITLSRVTETELTNPLTVTNPNSVTLSRVTELESTRSLSVTNPNSITLSRVTETEVVRSLTVDNPNSVTLSRITETEVVRELTVSNDSTVNLDRVTETEVTRPLTVDNPNSIALSRVTETEVVRNPSISSPNTVNLSRVTETEVVRPLSVTNPNVVTLDRVTESEVTRALNVSQGNVVVLGRVTETETVRSLSVVNPNTVVLSRVTESETTRGLSVAIAQAIQLSRITETEAVRTVAISFSSGTQVTNYYYFLMMAN